MIMLTPIMFEFAQSPLKYQTRCLTAFPDKAGYLVGSIEGRVAVHHVEEANAAKNFTFKCHRRARAQNNALLSNRRNASRDPLPAAGPLLALRCTELESSERPESDPRALHLTGSPALIACAGRTRTSTP